MRNYETLLIARQDVSASQAEALADQFISFLTAEGGEIARREYWGLKNLAYRIKKNRKGHYVLVNYAAPHSAVVEMERNMRLSEDILRFMTTRTDAKVEGPSVVMQRRDDRSERSERGGRGGNDRSKSDRPARAKAEGGDE
ncbi:MAG: 30S ribosomal protein S6 [Alphaproteobacteria bacterium]|nr:30S ribosomal protein S6 [Alphaproteobacteria bacterium]